MLEICLSRMFSACKVWGCSWERNCR